MPSLSKNSVVRGRILLLLTAFILAGFLATPSAFAKARKKTTHKRRSSGRSKAVLVMPPHYVPPARGYTTVVIDAGHGGIDPGGIQGQKIPEKPYTLDVARRLRSLLGSAGFRTVMTRSDDTFISLPERARIANAQHNAVFISIHFNSASNWTGYGLETYYYAYNAKPLADRIQAQILRGLPLQNRGVKSRGYFVLRNVNIPAVLVEGGFLTNPDDARRILQAGYRQKLAEMIARAIIDQRGH